MQDMLEPEDIFNPRHYDSVHRRFDSAETLPAWCYTSKKFYERERERIFFKFWNCIGHHEPRARDRQLHHLQLLRRAADRGARRGPRDPRLHQLLPASRLGDHGRRGHLPRHEVPLPCLGVRAERRPDGDAVVRGVGHLQDGRSRAEADQARPVGGLHVDQPRSRRAGPQELPRRSAGAHQAVGGRRHGLRLAPRLSGRPRTGSSISRTSATATTCRSSTSTRSTSRRCPSATSTIPPSISATT